MPLPLTAFRTHMSATVAATVGVAFAIGTTCIVALDFGDQQCVILALLIGYP